MQSLINRVSDEPLISYTRPQNSPMGVRHGKRQFFYPTKVSRQNLFIQRETLNAGHTIFLAENSEILIFAISLLKKGKMHWLGQGFKIGLNAK